MRLKFVVAVAVCAGFLGGPVAHAQNPTLAELAKKEEERRKGLKAAGKVVTNEDLPKSTVKPQPPVSDKGAAGSTPDEKAKPEEPAKAKAEGPAKDQSYWKERIGQVREELRRNEMFAEALQTRVNALTADFAARDDPHQRARVAEDRVKALSELERLKADMELQKKKIADIEEEARREGVPSGWLR